MAKLPKPKLGRPHEYTPELGDFICEIVATHTESLPRLHERFKDEGFPTDRAVNMWRWRYSDFGNKFNKAKAFQAQLLAEQIIEISDDSTNDYMQYEEGKTVLNTENINRSKLRVDARKYVASKLAPRQYGSRFIEDDDGFSHDTWIAEFTLKKTGANNNKDTEEESNEPKGA